MSLDSVGGGRSRARKGIVVSFLAAAISIASTGVAYADNIQDNIVDTGTGVSLVAGSSTGADANIKVVGNNAQGDPDDGCNWDIGESPLVLDIVTPAGVTANPDPLSVTTCGVDQTVTFKAAATAVSGTATVSITSTPAGGGTYNNQVNIPITIIPGNTKPSVAVTGVTSGASYEIGAVPSARCSVTDTEDGASSFAATLSGTLSHGLGTQTATCDYTDTGGLKADTKTASYTIVDTGDPRIGHTLSPATPNGSNGWYTSPVTIDFTCDDSGSGIQSCTGDTTLGNGANQSASGTATDWAGRTANDSVTGINVDGLAPNAPTATLSPAANPAGWNHTNVTVSFSSAGDNGDSGVASCSADVPVTAETAGQTVSGTCTDRAGNVSSVRQVTVKLDKTGPVISQDVTVSGTKGNGEWYVSPVEVTFSASDLLSGPTSETKKVTSSGNGAAVDVVSPTFTDTAGNTTDAGAVTKTYAIDTVAPSVGNPVLSGTEGTNGWYRSAVTASFTATDATSGVAGTNPQTVTSSTEGTGIVLTSPAFSDVAGNTTTDADAKSATVKIDSQAPNAPTATFSPAPNGDGWNKNDVTVSFADAGDNGASGVASCTADVPVTAETDGQTVSGTCTDAAGNVSEPKVVTVKLDKAGPVVSQDVGVTGTEGNGDWYTSPVKVSFTANDALSGPASESKEVTSSGDGEGVEVASPAFTDAAGNTTAAGAVTKTYKVDTVAPSVNNPVLTGSKGDNDWYQSAVTASFTATDATSGVAGINPQLVTSTQQGADIVLGSPEFSDNAGNTTAAGNKSATVKVDSVAPSVSLLYGPAAGTTYYFGNVPAAPACGASDGTSGLADADPDLAEQQDCIVSGYSTALGTHTVKATATDNAGNKSTDTHTYTVSAWTTKGFYAPVDMNGVVNTVKGGSTVPLKFELFAGSTELTDVAAVKSFGVAPVSCSTLTGTTDAVELTTTGGTSLRYDATGGQFIQNWKTPATVGSCYKTTMTADDGSKVSALFKIK